MARPEIEKDIFISYAHLDNETLTEEQKGWVTTFHHALEKRLGQLLAHLPNIWRDEKLQGNDYFGEEIVDQFQKLRVLVSILSPRYVESDWCRKELRTFYDVAQKFHGVRLGNKSRIFKVIKHPCLMSVIRRNRKTCLAMSSMKLMTRGDFTSSNSKSSRPTIINI